MRNSESLCLPEKPPDRAVQLAGERNLVLKTRRFHAKEMEK
jgi:hypothetical protein